MKRQSTDMLHGAILPNILRYTVPIILTGILQLLFNAMDMIIVGNYCGELSIAAVSATGALTNLLVCLVNGMAVGVGVCIAHAIGANEKETVRRSVQTAVLTALICGAVLSVIGVVLSEPLLHMIDTPSDILPLSASYMRYYFAGNLFIVMYNFCASILRANGDTKGPLIYLGVAGVLNVILNVCFVTVFQMNVAGVALATVISFGVSALLALRSLLRRQDMIHLELKSIRIYKEPLKKILRIGIPAGLQTSLFSIGNIFIQSAINSFDNSILISGCGAAANLEGFVYLTMNAFHQTSTNFTGQNSGAAQYGRVKKITYLCMISVTLTALAVSCAIYFNGPALLSIYLPNSQEAIAYGMMRMCYVCLPYFLCGIMEVLTGALRGMGSSIVPMVITVLGACVFRILWICIVFQIPAFHTPDAVYFSYPVSWILTAAAEYVAFLIVFRRKSREYAPHALDASRV